MCTASGGTTQSLAQEYSLTMTTSLVDAASNCTVKVRVMNPTYSAVSLKQDTVIGVADAALAIEKQVVQAEDEAEVSNFSCVCRLVPGPDTLAETHVTHRMGPSHPNWPRTPNHLPEAVGRDVSESQRRL